MADAYANRIATAVPPHDVHGAFLAFGRSLLAQDSRKLALFNRMADRSGIAHRYSVLEPGGPYRTVAAGCTCADRQSGTLHPASARNPGFGRNPFLSSVRGRLRRDA